MWIKYGIIALAFFIFTLVQTSFLPYSNSTGALPNLVFILFFILLFFAKAQEHYQALGIAITAGFFLDLALPYPFGISIVALVAVYFLRKGIAYFFEENQDTYLIFYFILLFSVCFVAYRLLMYILLTALGISFYFGPVIVISLLYNLVFACAGFYIYTCIVNRRVKDNQLKLFS